MSTADPESERVESLEMWERASKGWGKRADRIRDWGMPVSMALIDALDLQPGQRLLELAAGPGDTGFLAAELLEPGGTLICSDGTEGMLDVARARARSAGIENVEFKRLELEWIDLETASVDAALCRWGLMLITDPEAAAKEIRRVVRAGGRVAIAVWDVPERNPWATIPQRAVIERGYAERPDPDAPGMFRLAPADRLRQLLESSGLTDVQVAPVELERRYDAVEPYIDETLDLSGVLRSLMEQLDEEQRQTVRDGIHALAEPFTAEDGSLRLTGSSLVASASA